jgi:hypothetical protein
MTAFWFRPDPLGDWRSPRVQLFRLASSHRAGVLSPAGLTRSGKACAATGA